jgi:holliday junction DNA helicase RuvB
MTVLPGTFPETWDDYVGQERTKQQLRVAATSSRLRGGPMPPQLLVGPPGVGKTALAFLVAQDLGSDVFVNSGRIKAEQALLILTSMNDGDVWVLEEMHQLAKDAAWLLHFLENGVLLGPFGRADVPAVSVIGTTTNPGAFGQDVLQRVRQLQLEPYTDDEAAMIAMTFAQKLLVKEGLPDIDADTAAGVARAARNHPRTMRDYLTDMRDLLLAGEAGGGGSASGAANALSMVLSWSGMSPDGLRAGEVAYLRVLAKEFMGAPVGGAQLAERLSVSRSELAELERGLLDFGLIMRSGQGRRLTPAGAVRANKLEVAA